MAVIQYLLPPEQAASYQRSLGYQITTDQLAALARTGYGPAYRWLDNQACYDSEVLLSRATKRMSVADVAASILISALS